MSFRPGQQGFFQPLLAKAWSAHCRRLSLDADDKDGKRAWYEDELEKATGRRSSKHLNITRDFEDAMAHFEIIVGDSFEWQLKRETGDERRIMHGVRQFCPSFDCSSEWLLGIARQILGRAELPQWRELAEEDRVTILRAVKLQIARQDRRGDRTDKPRHAVEEPF